VPNSYWDCLAKKGIDYIWLMGIWKTCSSLIDKCCFEEGLIKSYDRALKGWKREDVIGSPYAIDAYEINPELGDHKSLLELKSRLNKKGMKLILDFVPNHFNADSRLIKSNPGIFISVNKELYSRDQHTFYQPNPKEQKYFAHGRDPFFPAWQDTIQVNIFSKEARKFLINTLLALTKVCDGVRCDMSMLLLNNVFNNTWGGVLDKNGFDKHEPEFWKETISETKNERADFIFIAEAYWDLEYDLQQLGFDFTYDKKLTDRLKYAPVKEIHDHLLAEIDYQKKSLRFIENHDEERAAAVIGKEKSKAAAVIISTIQGMRFYFDGQLEGKKIKLPVQLGREPEEQQNIELKDFYNKLLAITSKDIFSRGKWTLLEPAPSLENNSTYLNILSWLWTFKDEKRLVVVNYSETFSTCRIKLDVRGYPEDFPIKDLLNDQSYTRSAEEIYNIGLYIEQKPFNAHIFSF
jgi:glycosidase